MTLKEYIGTRIRSARREKALTQAQLAEAIGKAVESVSNVERGAALVGLDTLFQIAKALDKPMTFFFEGIEASRTVNSRRVNAEDELRLQAKALRDDDLALAIALVKTVARERA